MPSESPWSASEPIRGVLPGAREPTLTMVGDTLHVVWSRQRVLYHAACTGTAWTVPIKVAIGEQPALAATPAGQLHCIFSNQFAGNYEIFHVSWNGTRWSLPQPVSRTSGASRSPALATSGNGSLHAVWADTTPGYSVVYHGQLGTTFWTSLPIPNARGSMPSLALTPNGDLYVAWQDRLIAINCYEIFCAISSDGKWSLPQIISDTPAAHSLQPQLAANAQGGCHLLWQEAENALYTIQHSDRRPGGWSVPFTVPSDGADCRLPRLAANRQGFLQAVWLQGSKLCHRVRPPEYEAVWWPAETARGDYPGTGELGMAIGWSGTLHVVWTGDGGTAGRLLYHSQRQPIFKHTILLPIG